MIEFRLLAAHVLFTLRELFTLKMALFNGLDGALDLGSKARMHLYLLLAFAKISLKSCSSVR
jgi:hypothetical protein